jgi:hypothetical protein
MSHAGEYCCVGAGSEWPDCAYRLRPSDGVLEEEWLALVSSYGFAAHGFSVIQVVRFVSTLSHVARVTSPA